MREALDKAKLKAIYDRVAPRYDFQHSFLTGGSDQRGRKVVVEKAVRPGDRVLDCGGGTGSTALLALRRAGDSGTVVVLDMSDGMLSGARARAKQAGAKDRVAFCGGDMVELPFRDASFDVALSTYSMCPLYDPVKGAMELFRVVKPGGRIGIAHSTDPETPLVKRLAEVVEGVVWRLPSISLGCRSVSVLPILERAGCRVLFKRQIGIPLWPFLVFVLEKTARQEG